MVSFFKFLKDSNNPYSKSIEYALQRIKDGNSKELVTQIRRCKDKEERNRLKSALPGVCFSGKFRNRSIGGLIEHSGFICLDFDGFSNEEETIQFKNNLKEDAYVYSAWISPSGIGVKVLVKVPKDVENHKAYFSKLQQHFNSDKFDESCSDISRFCYESYDEDIYINTNSDLWLEKDLPDVEDIGTSEPIIPITSENNIISNLLEWWNKKYGHNKGSRNANLYKLAVAFNDFGINKTEAERVLFGFEEKDFNREEIKTTINSAYKKAHQFGTKFFEDKQTQNKIEKLIRVGKSQKDIVKNFPELTSEIIEDYSEKVKENLDLDEFWEYNDKNKIRLSVHKYKLWLEQHGFYKYYPAKNSSTFTFIQKDQNLLDETNEKRMKDYVLNYILSKPDVSYTPYDLMAGNPSYFNPNYLSMIDTATVNLKKDNKDTCYLYFKNCVVEITKDSIKEIDYIDIDGFVWKKQIIDREYKPFDHHQAVFRKFIWLIAGKDSKKYNSFKSVIGYLLHSFKTSANNKAVIFNDETISENPNGGSGKGLFWNGLKHMKKVSSIDGKTFDFKKSFPYQTVSSDTQILVFDDVKKNFDFESLFSLITEGITLEYKGQDAIQIPVEDSPKLLITTNYTLGGVGGSHERRKHELEMSDYFSSKHTPLDEFGHMLFSDWDEDEWLRFDNYMINCEQYFLKNGLIKHDFNNLETRKFIKETSYEFYEWCHEKDEYDAPNIKLNTQMNKSDRFEAFKSEYRDFEKWLKAKTFSKWLQSFATYKGYEFKEGRTAVMRYIEFVAENVESNNTDEDGCPF